MDIDKIIDIIRTLKEEGPTVSLGSGQIAGTVESGYDTPVNKKRKIYLYGVKGSRKMWMTKNVQ